MAASFDGPELGQKPTVRRRSNFYVSQLSHLDVCNVSRARPVGLNEERCVAKRDRETDRWRCERINAAFETNACSNCGDGQLARGNADNATRGNGDRDSSQIGT